MQLLLHRFALVLGLLTAGCATDYVHDPNALYPEDFETTFSKIDGCLYCQIKISFQCAFSVNIINYFLLRVLFEQY